VPPQWGEAPVFWKLDAVSGRITSYKEDEGKVSENGISFAEAETLEQAAVWSATHVEDRLKDLAHGRPCIWVEEPRRRLRAAAEALARAGSVDKQPRERVDAATSAIGADAQPRPAGNAERAPHTPSKGAQAAQPTSTRSTATWTKAAALKPMYAERYFPKRCVDKVKEVLVGLHEKIGAARPTDLAGLYKLTHAATVEINGLQALFEEHDSELETVAREAIAAEFEWIARAHGFDADVEEMMAPREW
jgi:hypothetical protein